MCGAPWLPLRAWAEVIASMLAFSTSWWDIVEETARNEKDGQPQSIYDPILVCKLCWTGMWLFDVRTDNFNWMTGLAPNSLSAMVNSSIQSQSLWCHPAIWVLIGDVIHRTFPWRKIQRIDVLFTPKIADSTTLRKKASAVTLSFFSATSWRMKQLTKH